MRTILFCIVVLCAFMSMALSQERIDVVYLKNGDIRKGTIIENVPNDYIKVETSDGSIFTIKYLDIEKMTREAKQVPIQNQERYSQHTPAGILSRGGDFGIMGALWLSGTMERGKYSDVTKETGFLTKIFYDGYLMEKLAVGLYVDLSPVSIKESTTGSTMIEIGVAFKPRFLLADGAAAIKPSISLGYRNFSSDNTYADKVNAMGLNAACEIQFYSPSVMPFIEIGFLGQPSGGNDYSDLTFPPIFYFGAGVIF